MYVESQDLANDWFTGQIGVDEEFVYKDLICVVVGDFVDEDGERHTELMVVDVARGSFAQQTPMGNGFHRVEFRMG